MNGKYVFQILEIEPTDDIREIKKAYARMVKKYHPEEYPEKWKEIHDAYETALKIAKQGQHIETMFHVKESSLPPEVISEKAEEENHQYVPVTKTEEKVEEKKENHQYTPVTKTEEKTETEGTADPQHEVEQETPEDKSLISMFENIEDLSQEQQEQYRREKALKQWILREKLEDFKEMAAEKKFDGDAWENYFNQEDILPIISQKEFLFQMGNFFLYKKINRKKYKFLMKQLARIEEYHEEHNVIFSDDEQDPVDFADSRIWESYRTYIIKRIIVFALICLVVLAALNIKKSGLTTEQKWEKRVEAIERQKRKDGERMYRSRVYDYNWYEEKHSWTNELILEFIQKFLINDVLTQNLQDSIDNAAVLKNGLAVWDWRSIIEQERESTSYELYELPVSEDMEKDFHIYAFCVTSDSEQKERILLCNLDALGFSDDCAIYYYTGEKYEEISKREPLTQEQTLNNGTPDEKILYEDWRCELLGWQAFVIETHVYDEQNLYPIILVEPSESADIQMGDMNDEEIQLFMKELMNEKDWAI